MARFVLILTLLWLLSDHARATADGPDCWRVRNVAKGDFLNLREKPSVRTAILARIPPDARCLKSKGEIADASGRIVEDSEDASFPKNFYAHWRKLEFEGKIGWAAVRYLGEDSAP